MNATAKASARGFSMMELAIVVSIVGIIAAIAVPKFADAGSGRRLSAAKKALIADIEMAQLRARATSKTHAIKFYPNENKYIIVEGTDVRKEAIILTRDFDDNPFNLGIKRTNIGGNEIVVVSVYGEISPSFTVQLIENGTSISVVFGGVANLGITTKLTISDLDAKLFKAIDLVPTK